ncbi:DUF1223 domain-containing protein [Salinisphaera dokdonensis]
MTRIRSVLPATLFTLFALLLVPAAQAAPRPVVLELFTSNGCSSCPPAYELLRELQARPPVDDVRLILLSQHVDYWNRLGWVDRYSSADFTQRQREYARDVFGSGRVYTPQLVVNGSDEMVASRGNEVRAAIERAADAADLGVTVDARTAGDGSIDVTARVERGQIAAPASVWFALTQDEVVSHIGAGENRGRKLIENGVVRTLRRAGHHPANADTVRSYRAQLPSPADVDRDDLLVVVFVQRDDDRVIVGAGQAALERARTASH